MPANRIAEKLDEIAEQKKVYEALRERCELFDAMIEGTSDVVYAKDSEGRYVFINSAATGVTDKDPADVIGKDDTFVFSADDARMIMERDRAVMAGGTPNTYEEVVTDAEGKQRVFLSTKGPYFDEKGHLAGLFGIARDITERKRAEERVYRQKAVLGGISQIFREALCAGTDEELGKICLAVAEGITGSRFGFVAEVGSDGLLHDIAISNPGWEQCAMADKAGHGSIGNFKVHGIYGKVMKDGKGFFTNDPSSHPDSAGLPEGHPPLTAFLGVPLIHDGHAIGMVAVGNREGGYGQEEQEALESLAPAIVMAFQRKRAEESLRQSEERFRTLAAGTYEGIAIIENGRFLDVNEQLARLLGYEQLEMIGMEVAATLPPEDLERVLTNIQSGAESHIEHEMVCKDGLRPIVEAHGQTIVQQGRQVRVTAIRDITERKVHEQELLLARQTAEAASRTKSQFLANMSHELRTPMTGILGMLEVALSGSLEEEQRDYIETAYKSARSLLRIINDILDMTRIEAGMLHVEDMPFCLRECVAGAVNILIPEARRKGIELVQSVADTVPQNVTGDRVRLMQALTNLVGNAVKFTEAGKVEVRVTASRKSSGGKRKIIFSVSDTGIGIVEDKKDIIFQSFSQADFSQTRRYGGTGLGLAISKEIAERMGGTITFESKEGVGSTFVLTVPLGEA